ncbi:glycosyl transferase [Blastococcus litoris]|uniref:glycosyl transferase n=1 Tax=Blastococcus litoris TaxID=2171622 RepID=UPI000E3052A3|nr:glycosyl transferase [Blastococcus litoris]
MTRPLRVLQSFPDPRPTTNPYVVLLARSLASTPGVEVATFSWKRALTWRYDVFHVHWPEILAEGSTPLRARLRRLLFLVLLLRLRATGTALVRTAHNVRPHEAADPATRLLLALTDRWTTLVIRLNDETPVAAGTPVVTVPHGHYRDWFEALPRTERDPRHLAFVGLVRPYKGVEELVRVFRGAGLDGATLTVAGRPADADLADRVRATAGGDRRVELRLAHLSDEDLVTEVSRSALVVLPYREMHNSGAALMALSLDRPVLLPDNEVTGRLADEVGPEWVLRYPGPLDAGALESALRSAGSLPRDARPDLARRGWREAGSAHLAAYRDAVAVRRRRAVSPRASS